MGVEDCDGSEDEGVGGCLAREAPSGVVPGKEEGRSGTGCGGGTDGEAKRGVGRVGGGDGKGEGRKGRGATRKEGKRTNEGERV